MYDLYETLSAAGTAVIADVFDFLGKEPSVLDNSVGYVGPVVTFAGPAYTITGESVRYEGGDRAKLAAIDAMPAGVVSVWASQNAQGVCCFGDLLATSMLARGCIAAVVDGGVRDTAFLKDFDMPVMSRYRTPAQGVGRWRVTGAQMPVRVTGALSTWITVNPGDIIVGDGDGVIVVPQEIASEVAVKVDEWSKTESQSRDEIAKGLPLLEALVKFGHL